MLSSFMVYLFLKMVNFVQLWFNKNSLKFLNYPFTCGFLSSLYDMNVSDPKLKKNFIEEVFELGPDLWLGYLMHDGVMLTILAVLMYPSYMISYMLFGFWIDLFCAQLYNMSCIWYMFNLLLLIPAFSFWLYKQINNFFADWFLYFVNFSLLAVSHFWFINLFLFLFKKMINMNNYKKSISMSWFM